MSRKQKRKKLWRPRVRWLRKPQTQVVPNRHQPTRQELKRQAKRAMGEGDESDGA